MTNLTTIEDDDLNDSSVSSSGLAYINLKDSLFYSIEDQDQFVINIFALNRNSPSDSSINLENYLPSKSNYCASLIN